jgi:sialic acid synthase SpsE
MNCTRKLTLLGNGTKQIFAAAKDEGLICFSSPFDFTAVDLLEQS